MERPLSGIRVIGLEQYMAGPYCSLLLADAGAEVIKIERPGRGDPRRAMPPFTAEGDDRRAVGFMSYNRNKKSLALDIQKPDGQAVLKDLYAHADVVIDNLRPGALEKLGLHDSPARALNERLVWASISGFGRLEGYRGPYSDRPAFDIVAEAMSGVMHMVGFADKPPSWTLYGMADIYTGLTTAFGIMQALFMRQQTGVGQTVDSAMFDNMLSLNESMVALHAAAGQSPMRGKLLNAWPRGAYETSDGWVAVNVPDNIVWSRLAETIGRADLVDDPISKNGPDRAANAATLQPILESWFAGRTRAEAVDILNGAGVPTGPVNTAEDIVADPHVAARGMVMAVDDPIAGEQHFTRTPLHLSAAPELPARAAPRLGEHSRETLSNILEYEAERIDSLIDAGVVGEP